MGWGMVGVLENNAVDVVQTNSHYVLLIILHDFKF